jgi:hypothetical protein
MPLIDEPTRPRGFTAIPLHPLWLAATPVLYLFAENAVQQVTLEPLWPVLAAVLAGAGSLVVVAAAVLRDWRRGALVASLLIALFFAFGHVTNLVAGWSGDRDRYVVAVEMGVIAALGMLTIRRGGRFVVPLTRFLNVAALILFAFNLVRVGEFAAGVSLRAPASAAAAGPAALNLQAAERRPDIYYLILDRYSSAETLERRYGYDNRPFLDELERRGFSIADDSWANYFKTALSLTSSLSMDFLDGPALERRAGPASFEPLHTALRGRLAVPAALKSIGYEYVHIANSWEPTATNVDADRVLRFAGGSEFSSAVLATTAWSLTQPIEPPSDLGEVDSDILEMGYRETARAHTLFQFDRLDDTLSRPGPTFVFAHVLIPHSPWRFNADGSFPSPAEVGRRTKAESYLQHVEWANSRVLAWLDRALDAPPDEQPIVIIQADEGEFPDRYAADQTDFDWLSATPDELQWKYGILNAFHLPGVDAQRAGLTDRTSPVNAFRIVFNAYFGTDLPLLPDVAYLSPSHRRLYDFVPYERP